MSALGQRSSAIVDQAGNLARFGINDATRAATGEAMTFRASEGINGAGAVGRTVDAVAGELRQATRYEWLAWAMNPSVSHLHRC